VIGVLYGDRVRGGQGDRVGRAGAELAEALARGVATGLDRLEQEQAARESEQKRSRMETELQIARDIQIGFLPETLPRPAGWDVAVNFRPAREVSGDFYDAFPLSETHLALVIADVCDKGVGPALFMSLFRSLLRAFAQQSLGRPLTWAGQTLPGPGGTPSGRWAALLADFTALSAVALTNSYVASTHGASCMYATLFFGVLDTATGWLTYVNAGHNEPLHLGPGGVKGRLAVTGPAAGVRAEAVFDLGKVLLAPGDTLFAYTDGVTEARDPAGAFFTEQRLLSFLAAPVVSGSDLLNGVVARLTEHWAGAEPSDDVTMLAVRRWPNPGLAAGGGTGAP
jgi:sigma-B regulation protein RsbU (phosphoserine phosphatase)